MNIFTVSAIKTALAEYNYKNPGQEQYEYKFAFSEEAMSEDFKAVVLQKFHDGGVQLLELTEVPEFLRPYL